MDKIAKNLQLALMVIILISTVIAVGIEMKNMFLNQSVTLADLLLMFLYLEVMAMVRVFWEEQSISISLPLLIAITALSRFIILQGKQMDASQLLYESIAIVLIALAIVVLRLRHSDKLGLSKISPYMSDLMKAYEAPYPSPKYKMGCRAMPSHVPIIPDQSLDAQKKAREFFNKTDKPFLSVFAGDDPVTNAMEQDVLKMVPNAISAPNIGGGHFYQWTKPKELSKVLSAFIKQ